VNVARLGLGHDVFVDRDDGASSADLQGVGCHFRRAHFSDEDEPVSDSLAIDTELHTTYVDSCLETRSSLVNRIVNCMLQIEEAI